MKIKIFTLFGALALGVVSSMAQLSWMYDGETLEDGTTVTMNAEMADFMVGYTIDVYNASDNSVNCVVRRSNVMPEGSVFQMCTDNCVIGDESDSFSIEPNSTYKSKIGMGFHISNTSMMEPGEASATFRRSEQQRGFHFFAVGRGQCRCVGVQCHFTRWNIGLEWRSWRQPSARHRPYWPHGGKLRCGCRRCAALWHRPYKGHLFGGYI